MTRGIRAAPRGNDTTFPVAIETSVGVVEVVNSIKKFVSALHRIIRSRIRRAFDKRVRAKARHTCDLNLLVALVILCCDIVLWCCDVLPCLDFCIVTWREKYKGISTSSLWSRWVAFIRIILLGTWCRCPCVVNIPNLDGGRKIKFAEMIRIQFLISRCRQRVFDFVYRRSETSSNHILRGTKREISRPSAPIRRPVARFLSL